jgi:hypothetical protein
MSDSITEQRDCVVYERLVAATPAELARLRKHLGVSADATPESIYKAWSAAAANSIVGPLGTLLGGRPPSYRDMLLQVIRHQRRRQPRFPPLDALSTAELEDRALRNQLASQQAGTTKLGAGLASGIAAGAAALSGQSAARLSLAALPAAGALGAGAAAYFVVFKVAGPAFRKIVPATVELVLIGRRIDATPEE